MLLGNGATSVDLCLFGSIAIQLGIGDSVMIGNVEESGQQASKLCQGIRRDTVCRIPATIGRGALFYHQS